MSLPTADGDIQRLTSLLQCMNISHSDQLGDFRCLAHTSYNLTRNEALRNILDNICSVNDEDGEENSTLKLNLSGAFTDGFEASSIKRRIQTHVAVKGFLRQRDDVAATKMFGLISLLQSLPAKVKLVRIDISHNALGGHDAVEASEAFQGLTNLSELNMSYNQIGAEGACAIFSVLLGHPLCKISKLDLQWNWSCIDASDHQALLVTVVRILRHQNRSLTELNLAGIGIEPSAYLARAFYDFSEAASLFDIQEKHNHYLRVCTLEHGGSMEANNMLAAALKMNEGGPTKAIERKIDYYLEHNKSAMFGDNEDPSHVCRCLEVVGKYGSMSTLLKSVQNFAANGSLIITRSLHYHE